MAILFHEVQFPVDISYGAVGGPSYSTGVITSMSGGEQRGQHWAQSRIKYDVSQNVKKKEQLDRLVAFFRARKGKAYGFRFKDWADYAATGEPCVKQNNPLQYQLTKTYVDDAGYTDIRTIKKPVLGTVVIYVNGIVTTTGFSVDYTTGIVEFLDSQGSATVTADFEFDVPMRFENDEMPISHDTYEVYSWGNITLIEIKV